MHKQNCFKLPLMPHKQHVTPLRQYRTPLGIPVDGRCAVQLASLSVRSVTLACFKMSTCVPACCVGGAHALHGTPSECSPDTMRANVTETVKQAGRVALFMMSYYLGQTTMDHRHDEQLHR